MNGELSHKLRMALDCVSRAQDGIESSCWDYSLKQVSKATVLLSEAAFELQRLDLIEKHDEAKR